MLTQLLPSLRPPPRMSRPLKVGVHTGAEVVLGQALWMDRLALCLACRETFAVGQELDARVDLGGTGPPVTLFLVIGAVELKAVGGVFFHAARWAVVDKDEERRLLGVLAGIRPEAFPSITPIPWVDRPPAPPAPKAAAPAPRRPATPEPVAESASSLPPEPERVAPSPDRAALPKVASTPPPPHVLFSPGPGGGAVLVPVPSLETLRHIVALTADRVCLALPAIQGLFLDDAVTVALRLEDGVFIDLEGVVVSARGSVIVLEARNPSPDTRVLLRGLLEAA